MNNKPQIKIGKISVEHCPKTSPDYGYFYEDILKKKSLRYIDGLKSIYDPGIFTKNSRNIEAIKAFIIQGENKKKIIDNFNNAIYHNDFILFPYFDYEHDFSVDEDAYQIKKKGNIIQVFRYISKEKNEVNYFYEEGKDIYFYHNKEKYYYEDFRINNQDCLQIYLLNRNIFLITFYSNIEIDGFFVAEKEFNISDYKAEEFHIFKPNQNPVINKGSQIIYEVKSGNNLLSLSEQIARDYEFFEKFFNIYPGYNIKNFVIFGFLRTNQKLNNFENSPDFKKNNDIPIPVILFRYEDTLFGENVFYESVELGEINELKYLVKQNSQKIENLDSKIDNLDKKFSGEIGDIKNSIKEILEEIKNRLPDNKKSENQENNQPNATQQNFQPYGNQAMFPNSHGPIFIWPWNYPFNQNPPFNEINSKKFGEH